MMEFRDHSKLKDQHAFLSASKYNWINYDEEKLAQAYMRWQAVQRGTDLHAYAAESIRLGIKLPKTRKTLNMFVNDAIGFRMNPEQVLFYSLNCFGTADAICFRNDILRIHDLKTGETRASMNQLKIYAALFCLEYEVDPRKIQIKLCIYQYDDVNVLEPDPNDILAIMDKIIAFDKKIDNIKNGEW